jgi:hypothetical protein
MKTLEADPSPKEPLAEAPKKLAPKEPYRYENGAVIETLAEPSPPFVPDQGFDGPA